MKDQVRIKGFAAALNEEFPAFPGREVEAAARELHAQLNEGTRGRHHVSEAARWVKTLRPDAGPSDVVAEWPRYEDRLLHEGFRSVETEPMNLGHLKQTIDRDGSAVSLEEVA